VGLFAAASYAARLSGGKPDTDTLYKYSFFVSGAIQYAIILLIVLAIAGFNRELLAWRRPRSWPRAAGLAVAVVIALIVVIQLLETVLHAGEEQGLVPDEWESSKAGAYALSFVAVAVIAPIVEELTYRGLGYSLLEPFGKWVAIVVVGLTFAASHGLLEGFPELALFGAALAWLRSKTDSVFPGMAVHAVFNAAALILVVATA
jgi:membrane protease YdiL (CAAX protease family)